MKKILALLLCVLLTLSLSACGGGKKSEKKVKVTEAPKPVTAATDTDAMKLHFTPPAGYDTVERMIGKNGTGDTTEKSFTYTFADESSAMLGYTVGKQLTDSVPQETLDKAKTATYAGKEFKVIEQNKTLAAFYQEGTTIYAVGYSFKDKVDNAKFESLMAGISFTNATTTEENTDDLFGIRYDAKVAGNICGTSITLTEKPDGTLVNKSMSWHYGKNDDEPDYRFLIRVYKNSTVEEQLSKDKTYEDKVINGITYKVRKADEGKKPFEYFTQHGNDVYKIYNNGKSSSWFVDRSEQSEAAFAKFLNTISF